MQLTTLKTFIQKQIQKKFPNAQFTNAMMNCLNPNPLNKEEMKRIQKAKTLLNAQLHNLV